METVQGSKIVTEKQSNKLNNRLMEKIISRLIKRSTNQNSQCMSQNNLIFNILLPPLEVWFIHVSSDLHSTCPAKTQSTSSITPSCPTIPRSQSETSQVNYTFSCMYRAAYLVNNAVFSQSVFTKPSAFSRVATVYVNNGSLGTFRSQLSMNVFTNSKFLYAKDAPYVIDTSEIGSEVFIGIEAKGLSNRFKVVINNCWATPTPYSTDKKRWSLIINSCSSDNTVTIFENAKDSRSMFKFNSFRFQRLEKVSTVWLHCEVQVCDGDRLICHPGPCSHRSLAAEVEPSGGILTTEFHIKVSGSSNNGHIKGKQMMETVTEIYLTLTLREEIS
ncbi:Beta-tectorin [Larimichthys crocea]|uniref:Uncharacterized protein n=1 Tax=Larimichthys crocea TaxID=215358 RepID=A0ACD3RSC9_LARCR|nr:Beta-tectorin [Larimichthys crocea]